MSLEIFQTNLPDVEPKINLDIFYVNRHDPVKMRSLIVQLEDEMLQMSGEQVQLETRHKFCNGLYLREVILPKNTLLTGKVHHCETMNICSKGLITVITEDGMGLIEAGFSTASRPGIKRVGYTHEDTVWVTILATDETDIKKIEEKYFSNEFPEIQTVGEDFRVETSMEGILCQLLL